MSIEHGSPGLNPEKKEIEFKRAFEMVLKDNPTEPVDAVFLHPLSHGDDEDMFPVAAAFIKDGRAKYIVINGSDGQKFGGEKKGEAWAGKDEYIRRLEQLGVTQEQIVLSDPAFHTRQANDLYLKLAKQHGWKTAVTLNQPQQLLRATLGQIQAMEMQKYPMRVYAVFPEPWDAAKKVCGSQGQAQDRRYKLIGKEYDGILKYQGTGELPPFQDFFNYMEKRSEIK